MHKKTVLLLQFENLLIANACRGSWAGEFWDPLKNLKKEAELWPVSYQALEDNSLTVRWNRDEVHSYISGHKGEAIELAADKIQIHDLWGKLKLSHQTHEKDIRSMYFELLKQAGSLSLVRPSILPSANSSILEFFHSSMIELFLPSIF